MGSDSAAMDQESGGGGHTERVMCLSLTKEVEAPASFGFEPGDGPFQFDQLFTQMVVGQFFYGLDSQFFESRSQSAQCDFLSNICSIMSKGSDKIKAPSPQVRSRLT